MEGAQAGQIELAQRLLPRTHAWEVQELLVRSEGNATHMRVCLVDRGSKTRIRLDLRHLTAFDLGLSVFCPPELCEMQLIEVTDEGWEHPVWQFSATHAMEVLCREIVASVEQPPGS